MRIARRVALFILVNVLIVATLSVVVNVLGIRPYIQGAGLDLGALAAFALLWGFGAALLSLALSRVTARWMMRVAVIDPHAPRSPLEAALVSRVHALARAAGLPAMPQVGIYDSPEANAFATGPTRSRALVAVSSGLLASMDDGEVDGVLAHEIAHVANGDMVTMTLVQGVVNAFGLFLARVIGWAAGQAVREELRPAVTIAATIAFDLVFALLGAMVAATFSRRREFRADHGGAALVGRAKMVGALRALERRTAGMASATAPAIASLQISGKPGLLRLLATHPPLDERIAALEAS